MKICFCLQLHRSIRFWNSCQKCYKYLSDCSTLISNNSVRFLNVHCVRHWTEFGDCWASLSPYFSFSCFFSTWDLCFSYTKQLEVLPAYRLSLCFGLCCSFFIFLGLGAPKLPDFLMYSVFLWWEKRWLWPCLPWFLFSALLLCDLWSLNPCFTIYKMRTWLQFWLPIGVSTSFHSFLGLSFITFNLKKWSGSRST